MARGKRSAVIQIQKQVDTNDALLLRAQGMSYRAIAKQLGNSKSTTYEHVQAGLKALADVERENATALRDVLKERMRIVYEQLYPKVIAGDLQATKLWLQAIDTEARFSGLTSAPPAIIQNNIILKWPDAPVTAVYQPDMIIMGATDDD